MKLMSFKHISNESLDPATNAIPQQDVPQVIVDIIKTKLNQVDLDVTRSFADLGCTPDLWNEIINAINQALSLQLSAEVNYNTPADLINAVAAKIAEPLISKERLEAIQALHSYVNDADTLLAQLETMTDTSEEGLGDVLKRMLISSGDLFIKMGNSFKTSILRANKDLKRGELKTYFDSNRLKVSSVEKAPYEKFAEMQSNIVTGMKGPFKTAVDTVSEIYNELDLFSFANTSKKYLNDALLQISREEGKPASMNDFLQMIRNRTALLQNLQKNIATVFTNDKLLTLSTFKDNYKSMEEFKQVREDLLALQSRLDESSQLNGCIQDMEKTLQDIQTVVETDSQISKDFVGNILEITKYLSEACSFYGENISYQLALEHNHVLNLQSCWMALK